MQRNLDKLVVSTWALCPRSVCKPVRYKRSATSVQHPELKTSASTKLSSQDRLFSRVRQKRLYILSRVLKCTQSIRKEVLNIHSFCCHKNKTQFDHTSNTTMDVTGSTKASSQLPCFMSTSRQARHRWRQRRQDQWAVLDRYLDPRYVERNMNYALLKSVTSTGAYKWWSSLPFAQMGWRHVMDVANWTQIEHVC